MLGFFQFLFGVFLLCAGASWLVRGASTIAVALGIPKAVIGLTLVALGTSAPEFFVNVLAALNDNTDFALSNVSGSNLANMCVGFGLCCLLASANVSRREFGSDLMMASVIPVVVIIMVFVNSNRDLPLLAVIPLTICLLVYLRSLRGRNIEEEAAEQDASLMSAGFRFLAGIVGLYFGGELVLDAAITAAADFGVPEDVIGLTIVAFGTSVPDIFTSLLAARSNEHGIAVGNILGSNISNLVVVLNSTLWVSFDSLSTNAGVRTDFFAVAACSIFVAYLGFRFEAIPRWAGSLMLVVYVGYLVGRVLMR